MNSKAYTSVCFIMPAYNVGKYISRAIESVIGQTCQSWNMIVVNDASTDNTPDIIKDYAAKDPRISYIDLPINQGNAYKVRKFAIETATAEFVAPIDADDWLDPGYLEKLLNRREDTDADIVYPTMVNPATGNTLVPVPDFDISSVDKGKKFVIQTINCWKIGANGGIIRKSLYLAQYKEKYNTNYIFSDEYLTRRLLFDAPKVAFSNARYFYFTNDTSVTHLPTSRIFDKLICDEYLSQFIVKNYGYSSPEYINVEIQRFLDIVNSMRYLNRQHKRLSRFGQIKGLVSIRKSYDRIDWKTVRRNIGWKYYYMMRAGLSFAFRFLRTYDRILAK